LHKGEYKGGLLATTGERLTGTSGTSHYLLSLSNTINHEQSLLVRCLAGQEANSTHGNGFSGSNHVLPLSTQISDKVRKDGATG